MKNLVQDGRTIQHKVGDTAVKSGGIVVVGEVAGVAITDGAKGDTIALSVEGVYSLPKEAGAIAQGKKVYAKVAEDSTVSITATAAGNTFVGYAWNAATAADANVDVKLSF